MAEKSTYYRDTIPRLIKKYKLAIEQCLDIIGKDFEEDELKSDKLPNVIKAKRMASEDVKFYAKEIDDLENEINGVHIKEKVEKTGAEAFTVER